jgi:multidrug efflux pump subunit AcrB
MAVTTMVVVAFFFMADWRCAIWIGLSVMSIEVGVIGIMSWFGIALDAISAVTLVMCVGFSVDFSSHVSHAYITSKSSTSNGKVEEALKNVGQPIIQGALSTFAGVCLMPLIPSYLCRIFFAAVSLVVFLGAVHGLLFLPVMLSIFVKPKKQADELQQVFQSKIPTSRGNCASKNGTMGIDRLETAVTDSASVAMVNSIFVEDEAAITMKPSKVISLPIEFNCHI